MIKSVAVVAGSYVLSVVLVMASDPLLSLFFPGDFVRGRVPSDAALAASTGLFIAVSILCAWVCARFAPGRSGRHVLALFVVGEAMGLGFTIANWNNGWPRWYSLAWLASWPLSCWIGFLLSGRKAPAPAAS
jgi:hypothetical protein